MAIYYIDPAATGANNGTSLANAWTGMATARAAYTTPVTGDEFRVAYTLNETLSAALAFIVNNSGSNRGIRFTSIDPANDTYRAGAKIVTAGFAVDLYGLVEGFVFDGTTAAAHLNVRPGPGSDFAFCSFLKQPGFSFQFAGTSNQRGVLRQCTLDQGSGYTAPCFITNSAWSDLEVLNCTLGGTRGATASLVGQNLAASSARFRFVGTDVSAFSSMLDHVGGNGSGYLDVRIEGGSEPASFEAEAGAGDLVLRKGGQLAMLLTANGNLSAPAVARKYWNHHGKGVIQSSVYRVGGGHDGWTRQAWALTGFANRCWKRSREAIIVPVVSGGWVAAGQPVKARIYLGHTGAALTNDDLGFRIYAPSDASPATAMPYTTNSAGDPGAAAAAYPTDSVSSWSGGMTTKQYVEIGFTATVDGPVTGEVMFHPQGGTDRTIYLDAGIFLS